MHKLKTSRGSESREFWPEINLKIKSANPGERKEDINGVPHYCRGVRLRLISGGGTSSRLARGRVLDLMETDGHSRVIGVPSA
jgi:hypothetical protein